MSTRSSDLRTALIKRKPVLVIAAGFALLAAIIPIAVLADDQTATQAAGVAADTVWVIVTGCLVMFMKAGFAMLSSAHALAQFYDRDALPEMAKAGMDGFQRYMLKPEERGEILKRLEQVRTRVYK